MRFGPRGKILWGGLAILCASAPFIVPHIPNWRWGGAALVGKGIISEPVRRTITLKPGATIICEGDSLTYGFARFGGVLPPINGAGTARVAIPYPEELGRLLGHGITVINRGYPGDRAEDALRRWVDAPSGDLLILMLGSNDADPRGTRGGAIPLDRYQQQLEALVLRRKREGAQIIIMAPPPAGTLYAEKAIAPYRLAARQMALKTGAAFVDPLTFIQSITVPLDYDGLHHQPKTSAAIAQGLAGMIHVVERAGASR